MMYGMKRNGLHKRQNILTRDGVLMLLRAALDSSETRFVRQTALAWLAAFPGDLEVSLLQAQALIAEGRPGQAIPMLELACRKDPFWLTASQALARACQDVDPARQRRALTVSFGLGGSVQPQTGLEAWGEPLRFAWQALEAGQYAEAGRMVQAALRLEPDLLVAAAVNMLVCRHTCKVREVLELARAYHDRWPDCLPVALVLAEAQLAAGNEPEAVRLLHFCAANDTTGQTARRMWGAYHPYRSLWPGEEGTHPMVIHFDLPVPAGVAARLGWNQLGPGEAVQPALLPPEPGSGEGKPADGRVTDPDSLTEAGALSAALDAFLEEQEGQPGINSDDLAQDETADAEEQPAPEQPEQENQPGSRSNGAKRKSSLTRRVEKEFSRLAKSLKQPEIGRADGRYPVYVILSSFEGLTDQYGPQTAGVVDGELRRLAAQVRKRRGWEALVYYPDNATCMAQFDLTPVNPRDAWKIKHTVADLDAALSRRGEMIGALLIVGGDEVVPFHRLPNPTEDLDGEVSSDSPYATRDANYFVPEWPVGRLPGEAGPDAGLLLEQIRDVYRYHSQRGNGKASPGEDWWLRIRMAFERMIPIQARPNFGYTAAVWRRSSLAVFRPIGAPHTVLASPPNASGSFKPQRLSGASLGYYNLHGLEDSPAWYGQRDPFEQGIYPDYPVALSPADLHKNGHAPRFIFSEACYGGNIRGKREGDSLALKFLAMGTMGVVSSTCTAYGSVSTPLIAADLLGYLFWQHLKAGRTVGEALLWAKIDLVREMHRRQGYLDGEDQKTLISFVLYGDPLAAYEAAAAREKKIYRFKNHAVARTVSGVENAGVESAKLPPDTLDQVKKVVAEYLPGADLAGMRFCRLKVDPVEQAVGADRYGKKAGPGEDGRVVITVSKQVKVAQHLHHHFLRVTLDPSGKAVKMALSR